MKILKYLCLLIIKVERQKKKLFKGKMIFQVSHMKTLNIFA